MANHNPDRNGHTDIKAVATRHRTIMRYQLLGMRNDEIAEKMGMHPQTICFIVNSPLYIAEFKRLEEEATNLVLEKAADIGVKKVFLGEAIKSAETLVTLRDYSEEDGIRLRSATEILDRAGYTAPSKGSVTPTVNITITEEKRRGLDAVDAKFQQLNTAEPAIASGTT